MKAKLLLIAMILGLACATATLPGCSAGGHIGPVGGSASVG